MSIRSGFFNSTNHDRLYNAEDFSKIFDGIIRDGVFMSEGDHFNVTARTGMVVRVGTGRSWFLGTYTVSDEPIDFTVPAAHATLNRIDAIVIDVDKTPAVRANNVLYLEGTPATDPVPPTFASTTSHKQYPLCYIQVNVGTASMSQALITNKIGLEPCPFVTGILDKIDITTLIAQWESQWNQWKNRTVTETDAWIALHEQGWVNDKNQWVSDYNDWLDTFEAAANTWYAGWQSSMTTLQNNAESWINTFESDMTAWKNTQEEAFLEWWHELQEIAEDFDPVGVMKMVEGYTGKTTTFNPDGSIREDYTSGALLGYYQRTTFEENGDIWARLYDASGIASASKKTEFRPNGQIVETCFDGSYIEPTRSAQSTILLTRRTNGDTMGADSIRQVAWDYTGYTSGASGIPTITNNDSTMAELSNGEVFVATDPTSSYTGLKAGIVGTDNKISLSGITKIIATIKQSNENIRARGCMFLATAKQNAVSSSMIKSVNIDLEDGNDWVDIEMSITDVSESEAYLAFGVNAVDATTEVLAINKITLVKEEASYTYIYFKGGNPQYNRDDVTGGWLANDYTETNRYHLVPGTETEDGLDLTYSGISPNYAILGCVAPICLSPFKKIGFKAIPKEDGNKIYIGLARSKQNVISNNNTIWAVWTCSPNDSSHWCSKDISSLEGDWYIFFVQDTSTATGGFTISDIYLE